MKVLYYIEPWMELRDDFRYPTLRAVIGPEIKALKGADQRHEIVVLHGDGVSQAIRANSFSLPEALFVQIAQVDLQEIFPDYESAQSAWYNGTYSSEQSAHQRSLVKRALGAFVPDIVVLYETNAPYLSEMFPDAAILHSMFGAFSRIPFPSLSSFDPCGVYRNAFIRRYASEIRARVISDEERAALTEIRRLVGPVILRNDPLYQDIARLRRRFDYVMLLALQVDRYFAFTECSSYSSQRQLVEQTLASIPSNVAVVVTEHSEYPSPFSDSELRILRTKYSNFIYDRNFRNIPFVSQFIVPHVDGVITVSSSLAYQALFWKKPVYAVGDSQINGFATAESLEAIPASLTASAPDMDGFLYYLLSTAHVFSKFHHFDGSWLAREYDRAVQTHRKGKFDFSYFKAHSTPGVLVERFRNALRAAEFENALKSNKITAAPNVLLAKAMAACAVSFDLFDTLVQRPVVEPNELFQFVQLRVQELLGNKNFPFYRLRREAEADVRRPTGGNREVTLEEIYQRLGDNANLPASQLDAAMRIEIQTELDMIKPRHEVVRVFNYLRDLGWPVSIITDIYLRQSQIEAILERCEIRGWEVLLVSSETVKRKQNGTLYPIYLDSIMRSKGVVAAQNLHVGDNKLADGEMAQKYGIRTHIIPKSIDGLKNTKLGIVFKGALDTRNITVNTLLGLQSCRMFCDPHAGYDKDTLFDGDLFNFGYLAVGPIVSSFVRWLIDRAKQNGVEELFFLSRDGWIMKEVYDVFTAQVKNAPRSIYAYCSRRAAIVASLVTEEDVLEAASQDFDARTLRDFLEFRLGVTVDQVGSNLLDEFNYSETDTVSPYRDLSRFRSFLRAAAPVILENASKERDGYLAYLGSIGLKSGGDKRQAVVDIGYSGSMQQHLMKLLSLENLGGFYLLTHAHTRHNFKSAIFEGYLASLDDHRTELRHALNDHVFLFESVLSSKEGSLQRVLRNGSDLSFEFLDSEQETERRAFILPVHEGIVTFARDAYNWFRDYEDLWYVSPMAATRLFINFAEHPSRRDARMFERLVVENKFGGGDARLIADKSPMIKGDTGLSRGAYEHLVSVSKWRKGAQAALIGYVCTPNAGSKAFVAPATPVNVDSVFTSLDDPRTRKLRKLARDPYRFFSETKFRIARPLKYFFSPSRFGGIASNMVQKWALKRMKSRI